VTLWTQAITAAINALQYARTNLLGMKDMAE
jgi:hypothetical protein